MPVFLRLPLVVYPLAPHTSFAVLFFTSQPSAILPSTHTTAQRLNEDLGDLRIKPRAGAVLYELNSGLRPILNRPYF